MSTIELVFEGQHVTPAALDARWVAPIISAYAESLGAIGEVLRGKVLRAGGTKPRIQLLIDEKIVSLDVTTSLAQEAGTHLYSEVEVDADLVREARPPVNPIVSGRVTRLVPVEDVDPVEAWDRWYEAAGRPWSKVADIEGELGRDG